MRKLLCYRSVAAACLLFASLLIAPVVTLAQQTLGSINGTVTDISGAAMTGATVTATSDQTGFTRSTTTQSNGYWEILNLPVGTYRVTVKSANFQTLNYPAIQVQEMQAKTLNARLKPGQVSESVTVSANPLLNATDTTNGYTLDKEQIETTPLATGSFTQLAILAPGVNAELLSGLDTNAGLGNQNIWANGQSATSNTFQVNGMDVTNIFNGMSSSGDASQRYNFNIGGGSTSSSSSAGAADVGGASQTGTSVYGSNGNSLPSPPPEFLQELRVNTSMYDAQQGATSGAQIDANTSTGTNEFHGQVYGSLANNSMNSAPFLLQAAIPALAAGGGSISGGAGKSRAASLDGRGNDRRPDHQEQAVLLCGLSAFVRFRQFNGAFPDDRALGIDGRPFAGGTDSGGHKLEQRQGVHGNDRSGGAGAAAGEVADGWVSDSVVAGSRSADSIRRSERDAAGYVGRWRAIRARAQWTIS